MGQPQEILALAALENYLETRSQNALVKFWQLYPRPIPSWHVDMMNDESRNDFYRKEIQKNVKDKIVMDLGSGAGLLIKFALESGARHVYAVEQDPVLQVCLNHAFKQDIQNGKVTILAKNSKEVTHQDFIAGTPEIIIHEIFGRSLLNELVLETFQDLKQRQITHKDTSFIPQHFELKGCLSKQHKKSSIQDPQYANDFWFLEDISYFGKTTSTDPNDLGEDLSSPFSIFKIDLKNLAPQLESEILTSSSEEGNSLRVWFELKGETTTLTTDMRSNPKNHWGNSHYFLRSPKGEVKLKATYLNGKFLVHVQK